jgi:hypothetical protein
VNTASSAKVALAKVTPGVLHPRHSKVSASAKAAASGLSKPPPSEPVKGRRLPSPARTDGAAARVADFDMDISVADYFVGKFFFED